MIRCWHCGQYEWFCNARHFWLPVLQGLAWGVAGGTLAGTVFFGLMKVIG